MTKSDSSYATLSVTFIIKQALNPQNVKAKEANDSMPDIISLWGVSGAREQC